MTDAITSANNWLNGIFWGPPMLILLMGTGVLLTVLTGAVQFRHLGTLISVLISIPLLLRLQREFFGRGRREPAAASESS